MPGRGWCRVQAGARRTIPVMRRTFSGVATIENRETGDGRVFAPGCWVWEPAALTAEEMVFGWDSDDGDHMGAGEIGRLTALERVGDEIRVTGWAEDTWGGGEEWIARCEEAGSMGVSAVWDDYEVEVIDTTMEPTDDAPQDEAVAAAAGDPDPGDDGGVVLFSEASGNVLERWTRARFRRLDSVDMPAFVEARVTLDAAATEEPAEEAPAEEEAAARAVAAALPSGCGCGGHPGATIIRQHVTAEIPATCSCQNAAALAAAGALAVPMEPPREWYSYDADLFAGYRAQVAGDEFGTCRIPTATSSLAPTGEVYGYVSAWGVCHTGYHGECVLTPRSACAYARFLTGATLCADGHEIATGPLTLAGGHADLSLSYAGAVAHYDDTDTAFADVTVGEDEFGVWFRGALRPGAATADVVRAARGSALSGDWRPFGSDLELVATLAVNTPGFPIPRARVAAGGRITGLVASARFGPEHAGDAGPPPEIMDLDARLRLLEAPLVAAAKARLQDGARERALERLHG